MRNHLQSNHQQITVFNKNSFVNLEALQQNGKKLFHNMLIFENYPRLNENENTKESLRDQAPDGKRCDCLL